MISIRNKPRRVQIIAIILFLIGLVASYLIFSQKKASTDWEGTWDISYYYEHQPELIFQGTLVLQQKDSWQANLSLFPPKSTRPENIVVKNLIQIPTGELKGNLEHQTYKINGGYLLEDFIWQAEASDRFSGTGTCQAYCAEGTSETRIIWEGSRNSENG